MEIVKNVKEIWIKRKRYFDIHDQRITAALTIEDETPACIASVDEFKEYFHSNDVREITLSQYRQLTIQYEDHD